MEDQRGIELNEAEAPPVDEATTADVLLRQMDVLCENIAQLQEMVTARRHMVQCQNGAGEGAGPQPAEPELGEFAPVTARCIEAADAINEVFAPRELISGQSLVVNPPIRGRDFVDLDWPRTFWTCVQILKWSTCFVGILMCLSCLVAMVWDQDIIDPYLDKHFRGTVLESPLISIRDNWQVPLQRELQCTSSYFPIYKSGRSLFWEILHSTFLRDHKECNQKKSVILNTLRYTSCLGAKLTSNPCRQ